MNRWVWISALVLMAACKPHSHGDDHGHEHGEHATADEPEPIAVTRWTERYELFVEFPPPKPAAAVSYHAHVTRLSDFQAVTEGRFTVRYKRDGKVTAEASAGKILRAGIFKPEGPAPAAGRYTVEMSYEHGGTVDVFDCGRVDVAEKPLALSEEADAGEISFLKETQWKIPFSTAWATTREMRKGVVETAGSDQLTLGAPTSGRFFHDEREALAAGRRVKKGQVLGSIVPNVEGDDFTRLEASVEEANLAKQQLEAEIARVSPLVAEGLLPERRLIELKNELSVQNTRLVAARRRVGRVVAPGGGGGLPIRASMDGVLREVVVPNGEPVQAGAVLLRMAGTDHLWLRSRFVARPPGELVNAEPVSARLSEGKVVDLLGRARFLSNEPVVDPNTRLATWIADVEPGAVGAENELRPGAAVVLSVRAGAARKALAVPRKAIVEISTRPFVFVQSGGESFVKRRVTLGITDGTFIEVTSGVSDGERVVTTGGFDVHIASLSGTVESHRH
jgi:cobalt-zinc-cadmium efflux system membrane fusion protein